MKNPDDYSVFIEKKETLKIPDFKGFSYKCKTNY